MDKEQSKKLGNNLKSNKMKKSRRIFDEYQSENFNPDERYNLAYKRVKRIKGFYIHALVFVLVNAFIIISSYNRSLFGNEVFKMGNFFNRIFGNWFIGSRNVGFWQKSVFWTTLGKKKDSKNLWKKKKEKNGSRRSVQCSVSSVQ